MVMLGTNKWGLAWAETDGTINTCLTPWTRRSVAMCVALICSRAIAKLVS